METIKWAVNKMPKTADSNLPVMRLDEVRKARAFHESFPPVQRHSPGEAGPHGSPPGPERSLRQR